MVLASCRPADVPPYPAFTPREFEVLALLADGYTDKEIGERLSLSWKTVQVHVSNILRKLHTSNRVTAAVWWVRYTFPRSETFTPSNRAETQVLDELPEAVQRFCVSCREWWPDDDEFFPVIYGRTMERCRACTPTTQVTFPIPRVTQVV